MDCFIKDPQLPHCYHNRVPKMRAFHRDAGMM